MKIDDEKIAEIFEKLEQHEETLSSITNKVDMIANKIRNHIQERSSDHQTLLMDLLNIIDPDEFTMQPQDMIRRYSTKTKIQDEEKIKLQDINVDIVKPQEESKEDGKSIEDFLDGKVKLAKIDLAEFDYGQAEGGDQPVEKRSIVNQEGNRYDGEWIVGKQIKQGKGIQIWKDGSLYEGWWKNGMANGKGRLIHADGDIYDGQWLDDKANGFGHYYHLNGAKYQGNWLKDKQHGYGHESWPDGAKFEGQYAEGKKHGKGKFTWADNSTYVGMFEENNIEGHGEYSWNDGRKYVGTWQSNKMHGQGKFTWPDGRIYDGDYVDDKKEGNGTFLWPDGRKFEGGWKNGKQHGSGTYTNASGKVKQGEWADGKRVKWV